MDPDNYSAHEPDEVFNQPPALANYNLFEHDLPLREALHREGGGWIEAQAHEYGALLGAAEVIQLGELANRHPPLLRTHDRFGHRIDEVEFHPPGTNCCVSASPTPTIRSRGPAPVPVRTWPAARSTCFAIKSTRDRAARSRWPLP